jgi:hypothetical protein
MHLIARFSRGELIRAIGDAVHLYQDATDAFDDAACAALGFDQRAILVDVRLVGLFGNRDKIIWRGGLHSSIAHVASMIMWLGRVDKSIDARIEN